MGVANQQVARPRRCSDRAIKSAQRRIGRASACAVTQGQHVGFLDALEGAFDQRGDSCDGSFVCSAAID
jgi:hypothetical protein